MLPEGWESTTLGEIMDFRNGLNFSQSDSKNLIKVVGVSDFSLGNVLSRTDSLKETYVDQFKDDDLLQENDFLFVRSNGNKSLIGRCLYFPHIPEPISFSGFTIRGRLKNPLISATYIFQIVAGEYFRKYINLSGSGTNISNLSQEILSNTPLILPPLPEQKKIAAILSTWDRAIEGTEKLLANSQQQKKALMQHLLTGKKRLPGFTGEWKNYTLENILNVRKEKSLPSNKIPLFSLTIEGGITSKTDRYNREFLVKNKNEKKYKVVYPRDLVYNPANLRWGAINYSRIPHKVVVSPIYEVLYVNNIERFFPDLIYQYLMSPFQIEKFSSMIEGTLMERKAVKISPFLATKIRIPSEFPEQKAIAAVLSTADEEITAIESDLSRLRQEKKALMQQLLTGKRRVKVD